MVTKQTTVRNAYGIHCRPSGVIAKAAQGYDGKIEIKGPDGATAHPGSVLALLGLALTCGDTVQVTVEGPNEETMCNRLIELFDANFDFQR